MAGVRSTKSGPFFRRDPVKTFGDNVEHQMQVLADAGARHVEAQLRRGRRAPVSRIGGRVADHVVGRTRSLSGRPWHETAVVSVSAAGLSGAERLALFAAAARVESETHAFASAGAAIAHELRADALLKGLE